MFSIYGPTGRVFLGTLEQMRQIRRPHAVDRSRAVEPSLKDGHDSAVREAAEYGSSVTGGPVQRSAIAAYASTGQPVHHAWHDLPVSDVMRTQVLTLLVDTQVGDAWRQLALQGRGQAPVVSASGILVGMVTLAALTSPEPWPDTGNDGEPWDKWRAQSVEDVMLTPIPSVSPHADLRRAASLLIDSGLPGLPVVDEDGRVSGFVSRTDVLRAALKDAGLSVWS